MDKYKILSIILAFIVVTIMISLGVYVLKDVSNKMNEQNLYDNCCRGIPCTDTYYDNTTNLCHFTLCEQGLNVYTKNCTYKGENISLPTTAINMAVANVN